ncbi:EamA family transporter [Tropicimonas isoalkanivorans]|uniref:EamA-like transporter family protein n=1 Tax=Tropicimonas isoalkanivorans TaxID=441112 RepID=A0A1I1LH44_9RHOB|nr:EamA family transporter [Tropicimonas isoalkanivorans]SFC70318.1 EamA-like transporter family protein [Tropicimonas isoalkanivorans]
MDTWIAATLAAALFQTVRFALQKRLKQAGLSAAGATWARFVWSAPVLGLAVAVWIAASGVTVPPLTAAFWAFALAGGIGQILATICVVALFSRRNFAVGITFKKSEVLQTALVGWLVLGEGVSWSGLAALLLGLVALLVLADPFQEAAPDGTPMLRRVLSPSMGLGLASGAFFALAGVAYRGATLALGDGPVAFRAALALALATASQSLLMLLWFLWRDRAEIGRVLAAWRPGLAVGASSLAGSLCWFIVFALQTATYVYALGQVELLFSIAGGALFFRERLSGREWLGISLLMASLVVLVLVT